jgi:hypothetical protein
MTSGIYTPSDKDVTARATGATPIGKADVGKWLPIAWAPKDGSRIDLWIPRSASAPKDAKDYRSPDCVWNGSEWSSTLTGWSYKAHIPTFFMRPLPAPSLQREALAETPSSVEGVDNKDRAP